MPQSFEAAGLCGRRNEADAMFQNLTSGVPEAQITPCDERKLFIDLCVNHRSA
jgi:hypothetical protein